MPTYSRKSAERIQALKTEVEGQRELVATLEMQMDYCMQGIKTNRRPTEIDADLVKARAKLDKLQKELTRLKDKSQVSAKLAAAATNPAPAKRRFFPPSRKDSHGYDDAPDKYRNSTTKTIEG